ncbi:MAG: Gfo/Idh/MocA family oxidoreductase [Ferrovibrio sp.]|uniref:Gfo/Idh/MocA family protein n=1 Tax=Ferrovibrio sp. TaxID=1917215 RepID=UPI00262E3C9B|nr:Gfo/Idh/MocA family oxidoreductase [Ferrovibrio sp.]MCW0234961.1 Gfo/Idh/MocA family oxidoreductase [Ferrovibrio sp.]
MKKFALIGAAGYIAPRHMKAIKETGNDLAAAFDPNDSVGILDSYFPEADFFTEFERFDRHIDKMRRRANGVDYISICSPNYLHDAHIRFALRNRANAICEKPLVLNPWNIDGLSEIEQETGAKIYNVLQLRLHPVIRQLRERIAKAPAAKRFDVDLTYITSRGHWYGSSWKGNIQKSGGIATNIGVHFFDMLQWVFGECQENTVHVHRDDCAAGYLTYRQARVRWFLSIDARHLPPDIAAGKRTHRSIQIDGEELEFSEGFADLHTASYAEILKGNGFGLQEARPSIEAVYAIRQAVPVGLVGEYHPLCRSIS